MICIVYSPEKKYVHISVNDISYILYLSNQLNMVEHVNTTLCNQILSITNDSIYFHIFCPQIIRKYDALTTKYIDKIEIEVACSDHGVSSLGTDLKPRFLFEIKNDIYILCTKHIIKKEKVLQWNNYSNVIKNEKTNTIPSEFELLENYLQVNENIIYAYSENKLYVITILPNDLFDFDFAIETDDKILNIIKKSDHEICIILSSRILIFNINKNTITKTVSTNEPWILSFCSNNGQIHKIDLTNSKLETIQLVYQPVQKLMDVCFTYY